MTKAMVEKASSSVTSDASMRAGHERVANPRAWPTSEEGVRLMHAFCRIPDASIRETIIRYVEEQCAANIRS
jgi:dolichyl-phosphate-mannose--protein O-mannosyl transferase